MDATEREREAWGKFQRFLQEQFANCAPEAYSGWASEINSVHHCYVAFKGTHSHEGFHRESLSSLYGFYTTALQTGKEYADPITFPLAAAKVMELIKEYKLDEVIEIGIRKGDYAISQYEQQQAANRAMKRVMDHMLGPLMNLSNDDEEDDEEE